MNQRNFNKNITGTHKENAPENTMQQGRDKGLLFHKFQIMDDDNIYSVSFNGELSENESRELLAALRNCLYENMADYIQIYLKQHNLAYLDFISSKAPLEHNKIMELTEYLLHSNTYGIFDNYFGKADIFYAIADHQKWSAEDCCHGCYFTVKRTLTESENLYSYNIIGQAFNYNQDTGDETGYFAIMKSRNDGLVDNITVSDNEPVLPTFGCIDMMKLLSNIDSIQTAEQAIQIAIR